MLSRVVSLLLRDAGGRTGQDLSSEPGGAQDPSTVQTDFTDCSRWISLVSRRLLLLFVWTEVWSDSKSVKPFLVICLDQYETKGDSLKETSAPQQHCTDNESVPNLLSTPAAALI